MIRIGQQLPLFELTMALPNFNEPVENGKSAFANFNNDSFAGQWKVIYFYPKDFTFVCPTEIMEFAKINEQLVSSNAVLIGGSTDNEFCKLAWRREHPGLNRLNHYSFADPCGKFADALGLLSDAQVALRATLIVDPNNCVQHISVNNLDVGRKPEEVLRTLQALQTGGLTACNWAPGEDLITVD
jgi:peroxiredoxin (alkyl hydroperoxide reductase subunit C)